MNNMCFNVLTGVAGPIYYFENDDAMYISELGRFEILTKRAQNDVVYTTYIRAPLKERQWAQNERMMMTYKTETEAKRGHNYYHTLAGVHGDNWSEYLPFSQDGGPVEIVEVTINTKTVNS